MDVVGFMMNDVNAVSLKSVYLIAHCNLANSLICDDFHIMEAVQESTDKRNTVWQTEASAYSNISLP